MDIRIEKTKRSIKNAFIELRSRKSLERITVTGMGRAWLDPYGFIAGGLYDYSRGAVGNGNEHGVATARDGETQVGFHGIDFGDYGSDEITMPIFALTDEEYPIQIWE